MSNGTAATMRQNDYKGIRGLCIVKNLFSKHNME
jgi:hypothetical protein